MEVNRKKLYREEGPTARKRGGRKRSLGTCCPMIIPQDPNQRFRLDLVDDTQDTEAATINQRARDEDYPIVES